MKFTNKQFGMLLSTAFLLSTFIVSAVFGFDDRGGTRDSLSGLKKAIAESGAPSLTTQQETDIAAAVTALKAAIPAEPSQALTDARNAYNTAILAGDLAAAQTAAGVISGLITGQQNAVLIAEAKFNIDILNILKNGGQWSYLTQKYTSTELVRLLDLARGFGGGRGGGGGRR